MRLAFLNIATTRARIAGDTKRGNGEKPGGSKHEWG
jgi:hypothetical protein